MKWRKTWVLFLLAISVGSAQASSTNVRSALSTYVDQAVAGGGTTEPSSTAAAQKPATVMTPALKAAIDKSVKHQIQAILASKAFQVRIQSAVENELKQASPGYIRDARDAATRAIRRAIPVIKEGIERALAPPASHSHRSASTTTSLFYSVDVPLHSAHEQEHLIKNITKLGFNDYLASTEHGHPVVYIGRYGSVKRARAARKKLSALYSGNIGIIASSGKQIIP